MKSLTQLVIEVAEDLMKKKHPCSSLLKGFRPEVFHYLSEKLPLSQKLRYFTMFILSTALQIGFYANYYFK